MDLKTPNFFVSYREKRLLGLLPSDLPLAPILGPQPQLMDHWWASDHLPMDQTASMALQEPHQLPVKLALVLLLLGLLPVKDLLQVILWSKMAGDIMEVRNIDILLILIWNANGGLSAIAMLFQIRNLKKQNWPYVVKTTLTFCIKRKWILS